MQASVARAGEPTVGDTIWAVRTVAVPAGRTLRPGTWELTGPVELLGDPQVTRAGDSATVRYPLVVWQPGVHVVDMPGPVLIRADGGVDSLAPLPVTLSVGSVLPPRRDTTLAPQPEAGYVPRSETSWLPLLLALLLAALVLVPMHLLWRRRGRVVPAPPVPAPPPPPLARWLDLGETRAVLADAAERLLQAAVPPGLEADRRATLEAIDTLRFDDRDATEARALLARAETLLGRR